MLGPRCPSAERLAELIDFVGEQEALMPGNQAWADFRDLIDALDYLRSQEAN